MLDFSERRSSFCMYLETKVFKRCFSNISRACYSEIENIAVNYLALCLFKTIKGDTNTVLVRISVQRYSGTFRYLEKLPAVNYYHKALHLGCCSSPRSASKLYFRTCFFKNLVKDFISGFYYWCSTITCSKNPIVTTALLALSK